MSTQGRGGQNGARGGWTVSLLFIAIGCTSQVALAQVAPRPLSAPYVSVSVRSVQRAREVMEFLFGEIVRPDLSAALRQSILDEYGKPDGLPGLDLQRPLGIVGVLQPMPFAQRQAEERPSEPVPVEDAPSEAPLPPGKVEVAVRTADGETIFVTAAETPDQFDLDRFLSEQLCWLQFAGVTDLQQGRRLLDAGMSPTTHLRRVEGRNDLFLAQDDADGAIAFTVRQSGPDVYVGPLACGPLLDQLSALTVTPAEHGLRQHRFSGSAAAAHASQPVTAASCRA